MDDQKQSDQDASANSVRLFSAVSNSGVSDSSLEFLFKSDQTAGISSLLSPLSPVKVHKKVL